MRRACPFAHLPVRKFRFKLAEYITIKYLYTLKVTERNKLLSLSQFNPQFET
jgi:hypothetical protein